MPQYLVLRSFAAPFATTQGATVELPEHRAAPLVRNGYLAPLAAELPEHFPAFKHLEAAGLTTRESLDGITYEHLIALQGIGPTSASKILAALNE
jgi:hypothetical protein